MAEKQILEKLKEIVKGEIEHCKVCIKRNEEDLESKQFWIGALIQAKEILDILKQEEKV